MKRFSSNKLGAIIGIVGMLVGCTSNQTALSNANNSSPTTQPTERIYPTAWPTSTPYIQASYATPMPTTLPSDWPLPPTAPVSVTEYVDLLTDFVNAQPSNREQLDALLNAWAEQHQSTNAAKIIGQQYRTVDLNNDAQAEILITLPAGYPPVLILLTLDANGVYQPNWTLLTDQANGYRIWLVRDLTNDGKPEIVVHNAGCGAHTCSESINIVQWQAAKFHSILDLSATNPTMNWADLNADGTFELIINRGKVGSDGAGIQRKQTEIYAWDGERYTLSSITPDPIDSQHPYWLLLDGFAALENDDYALAQILFIAAANAQAPYPAIGIEGNELELTSAIARFQTLYTALLAGDEATAQAFYAQTQQSDADDKQWAAAFMSIHQQTADLQAACTAAQNSVAADQYLTGFSYQHRALPIQSLLCGRLP
ncbi:FG-GAP repeat domain-containing protein [Herpetosiphon geysericola]|uniref:VCBS repeat-containing protein n=1 Tax=Herpetosiphon geysericola TaxID=70996 RepID=A0A0P6Y4M2_9CHLR|nr:VCBS repeat-containing protein [Herpetosiphon geysericola]KPL91068.1 hypothetical protein SE18_04810 [Herpetosiphon geysericola]